MWSHSLQQMSVASNDWSRLQWEWEIGHESRPDPDDLRIVRRGFECPFTVVDEPDEPAVRAPPFMPVLRGVDVWEKRLRPAAAADGPEPLPVGDHAPFDRIVVTVLRKEDPVGIDRGKLGVVGVKTDMFPDFAFSAVERHFAEEAVAAEPGVDADRSAVRRKSDVGGDPDRPAAADDFLRKPVHEFRPGRRTAERVSRVRIR